MIEKAPRLRPYQLDDLAKINDAFRRHRRRVCYQAPTAAGKTVVAAEFICRQPDDRIVVIGHRDEIVGQLYRALARLGINYGIIAPGYPETTDRVQVASVMTLSRRLHRLNPKPSLLVIDEAHHAVASTWRNIIAALPDADILGMTATPRRLDGKPLGDIFDELVLGPTIAELIDERWLAPVTTFTPSRDPHLERVKIRMGDYAIDQISAVMSNTIIVEGAVAEYERLCPGARAIAFCVDVEHSELVAAAFCRRGYRAEHVDGNTQRSRRRDLIRALADGDIDILTNCGLVSEGLDVPSVQCVIGLRPTRSLALYLQMVGRALRPGKEMAYVLDCAGNVLQHGLPTAKRHWSLHGQQDVAGSGAGLCRCRKCGAVNDRTAQECIHCEAPLHHEREPRKIIDGQRLAEVIETPKNDRDLRDMTYRDAIKWAADNDGRLLESRLERIAAARGYNRGFVFYKRGRLLEEVLREIETYKRAQRALEYDEYDSKSG